MRLLVRSVKSGLNASMRSVMFGVCCGTVTGLTAVSIVCGGVLSRGVGVPAIDDVEPNVGDLSPAVISVRNSVLLLR